MEVVAVALALGMALTVVTGGSLGRVLDMRVRWISLVFLAFGIQLLLGLWNPAGGWPETPARILFFGSYLIVAVFCTRNIHLTGMSVVLVGVLMNVVVLLLNGAMPVRLPADATPAQQRALRQSITHEPEADAPRASFLGEIIVLPDPIGRSISFGDLVLGVGLVDLVFRSGQVRRRRRRGRRQDDLDGAFDDPWNAGDVELDVGPASADAFAPVDDAFEGVEHPDVVDAAHG